jgi:excisionase family DNA binding protein
MDVDRHIPLAEPLIDCKEAAAILGFSPVMVRRLAHDGQLPSIAFPFGKKGKFRYKFRVSELQAYLKSRSRAAQAVHYKGEGGNGQQRLF